MSETLVILRDETLIVLQLILIGFWCISFVHDASLLKEHR